MQIQLSTSSLSDGRWYEYLVRFALGGAAPAFTGLISSTFGASIGGLFLALPAIFCASATLIERHEIRRSNSGGRGERRGRKAAALDAFGAALGSLAMVAFARGLSFPIALWRSRRFFLLGDRVDSDRGQLMVREMGIEMFSATARVVMRGELWDDDGHQPVVDLLLQLFEGTLTRLLVRPPSQD